MRFFQTFCFGNYMLSVALLSWLAAQVCKTIINYLLCGTFEIERMYGAGGMPSAHSALVCSLTMAAARGVGLSSPFFALSFVLAAIVMYDAMGVRHETGEQAKVLNKLLDDWLADEPDSVREQHRKLKEKVGHTPFEVLSGALLGILIAVIVPPA